MSLNSNTTGLEEILASVNALPEAGAGEPTLQEKTVSPTTAQQQVTPDSGFDGLSKVTVNAMPTATQATPSIVVDANGKITASATQTAGYVSAGTKSATKQLTIQAAKTITPTTSSQTAVAKDRYTTGAVTVAGDANLVAGNIKSGVSIFGVAGSYEGSGGGGSVETCTVTIAGSNSSYYPVNVAYTSVDDGGKVIGVSQTVSASSVTITCVKGSTFAVKFKSTFGNSNPTNVSLLFSTSPTAVFKLDDDAITATINNRIGSSGGGVL